MDLVADSHPCELHHILLLHPRGLLQNPIVLIHHQQLDWSLLIMDTLSVYVSIALIIRGGQSSIYLCHHKPFKLYMMSWYVTNDFVVTTGIS